MEREASLGLPSLFLPPLLPVPSPLFEMIREESGGYAETSGGLGEGVAGWSEGGKGDWWGDLRGAGEIRGGWIRGEAGINYHGTKSPPGPKGAWASLVVISGSDKVSAVLAPFRSTATFTSVTCTLGL